MNGAQLRQIGAGVYAWIGAGGDSNAGAIETPNGLVVVDAQQNRSLGEKFRNALKTSLAQPIRTLVNTHYHLDHVAGNVAFADAAILAHEKSLRALEREIGSSSEEKIVGDSLSKARLFFGSNFTQLVPEHERGWFLGRIGNEAPIPVLPPSESFADRMMFRLPGDDTLHIEYWGPAHCDGDLVIYLRKSGIAFLGDLFFNGRFPWFGDCDLDGWIAALDRVLKMDVGTVVPGHGEPASLKEVAAFRALLAAIRTAVQQAVSTGLSEDAAVNEIALADYAAMPRYKEWMPFNVRSAYRYLRG
ncbi:MAG TPA: MBL fold metallo-hydrolase [Pseudolabrys sp.]|nr:MBL fold metallo-hydrolase [Pseudolabrys sp.]